MKKLNGWVRIGIIASFAWIPFGAWYSGQAQGKHDAIFLQESADLESQCLDSSRLDRRDACTKADDDRFALLVSPSAISANQSETAIIAFGPIPFAWGFVFMVFGLTRWVKRGFTTTVPFKSQEAKS